MTSFAASVAAAPSDGKTAEVRFDNVGKVIRTIDDVTKEWLSDKLGAEVTRFDFKRIGTGQVSFCFRSELEYAEGNSGPSSVVLKLASDNIDSRTSARMLNLYSREVLFYLEAAPLVPNGAVATVYHTSYDEEDDTCCILMEDMSPCVVGNDIEGHTLEQARLAMTALGKIHAPFLGNAEFEGKPWLNLPMQLPPAMLEAVSKEFLSTYEDRITPEHKEIVQKFVAAFEAYTTNTDNLGPMGVVHADYRGDNILWKTDAAGRLASASAVDWQTLLWGPVLMDVAYFLGTSLTTDNRRAWEEELIGVYHSSLGPNPGFTLEQCIETVKMHTFFGVLMAVMSPMLVQRTERGDDMFMLMLERNCNHVQDAGAVDLLPTPEAKVPLKPLTEDDSKTHEPQPDKYWQESWYFDFVDLKQKVGGYVRLGIDPGSGRSWYTAIICGPDRPTISIIDYNAPVPDDQLTIKTSRFVAEQACVSELKEYRVHVKATKAESHIIPAQLLQGTSGEAVPASMDLVWKTDGVPYAYRLTTRYEIPCTVSGEIQISDETIKISNCPGQRDHSWGARDWWSMDWIWSALHLDDGTHIHGLDLRIPQAPRMSCGYVQKDGNIVEVDSCAVDAKFENGLPKSAHFKIDGKEYNFKAHGHGPLLLVSDDGRIGQFPRTWGTINGGVAWVEWMLNGVVGSDV